MASFDQAVAQAEPDQHVAAKSLDDGHALALPRAAAGTSARDGPSGKPVQDLIDQRKRLLDLAYRVIQTRALTSPSFSDGTSKRRRS